MIDTLSIASSGVANEQLPNNGGDGGPGTPIGQPNGGGGGGGSGGGVGNPQPTWFNGITRQAEPGYPPTGWVKHSDGYWYPPSQPNPEPISLSDFLEITPFITDAVQVSYVLGSNVPVPSITYRLKNLSPEITMKIVINGADALHFNKTQFSLKPHTTDTFTISFDSIKLNSLKEGINGTSIILNLSSDTVIQNPGTNNNNGGFTQVTSSLIPVMSSSNPPPIIQPPVVQPPVINPPISIIPPPPPQIVNTVITGSTTQIGDLPNNSGSIISVPSQPPISIIPPPPITILTWRNGVTRQTQNGVPPTGWTLNTDGFWYPPATLPPISFDFNFSELAPSFNRIASTNSMNGMLSVVVLNGNRTLFTYQWNLDVLNQGKGIMNGTGMLDFVGSWVMTPRDILSLQNNGQTTRTVEMIASSGNQVYRVQKVVTFTETISGMPVAGTIGGDSVNTSPIKKSLLLN